MCIWIVVSALLAIVVIAMIVIALFLRPVFRARMSELGETKRELFFLYDWLDVMRRNPGKLEHSIEDKGAHTVAIYGTNPLGMQVFHELKDSSVKIRYFIGGSRGDFSCNVPIYSMDEQLPEVDAVLVAHLGDYENIEKKLGKNFDGKLLWLEDLI